MYNVSIVLFALYSNKVILKKKNQCFLKHSACAHHNEQDGKACSRGLPYRVSHLFLHDQLLEDSFPNRVGYHNAIFVRCWVCSHPFPERLLQLQFDNSRSLPKEMIALSVSFPLVSYCGTW